MVYYILLCYSLVLVMSVYKTANIVVNLTTEYTPSITDKQRELLVAAAFCGMLLSPTNELDVNTRSNLSAGIYNNSVTVEIPGIFGNEMCQVTMTNSILYLSYRTGGNTKSLIIEDKTNITNALDFMFFAADNVDLEYI